MLTFLDRDRKVLWSVDLEAEVAGMAPEGGGGRGGYSPRRRTLAPPVEEKLASRWEFFTDDNAFMYCTNYEYLLLV